MSQAIQQRPNLPITESLTFVPLLAPRKQVVGMYVSHGNQLQHPHFRRAKSGAAVWKFFEQYSHGVL
jgi:hypothetical protein